MNGAPSNDTGGLSVYVCPRCGHVARGEDARTSQPDEPRADAARLGNDCISVVIGIWVIAFGGTFWLGLAVALTIGLLGRFAIGRSR